jgi:hypothetical protein
MYKPVLLFLALFSMYSCSKSIEHNSLSIVPTSLFVRPTVPSDTVTAQRNMNGCGNRIGAYIVRLDDGSNFSIHNSGGGFGEFQGEEIQAQINGQFYPCTTEGWNDNLIEVQISKIPINFTYGELSFSITTHDRKRYKTPSYQIVAARLNPLQNQREPKFLYRCQE